MKDNPILDDETIRRKRAVINQFMPLLNAAAGDDRPYTVEVSAHRVGEKPRSFGAITLSNGKGTIMGDIHAHELEIGFVGMALSLYGDVLVRTGAHLLDIPDDEAADGYTVQEHDAATPVDF